MKVELDVTFETYRPISQGLGMQFWTMGNHFCSIPGHSTYRLKSSGDAESVQAAVDGLAAQIVNVVADAYPNWPEVQIVSVEAKRVPSVDRYYEEAFTAMRGGA